MSSYGSVILRVPKVSGTLVSQVKTVVEDPDLSIFLNSATFYSKRGIVINTLPDPT